MKFRAGAIALVAAALTAVPVLAHHTGARHGSACCHHRAADVRAAQEKLGALGYDTGSVDGKVGPHTRAAIEKFQADKGLDRTGRLDHRTMAALDVHRGQSNTPTAGAR